MTFEETNLRSVVATLTSNEVEVILAGAALAKLPGQPVSCFSPNVSFSVALDKETGEATIHITVNNKRTGADKK